MLAWCATGGPLGGVGSGVVVCFPGSRGVLRLSASEVSVWSMCSTMVAFPRIPPRARIAEPVETYPMDHAASTTGSRRLHVYTSPCKTEGALCSSCSVFVLPCVSCESWCGRRTPVESGGGDGACLWVYLPSLGHVEAFVGGGG